MKTSSPEYIPLPDCLDRGIYELDSRNLVTGVFRKETGGFVGIWQKFGNRFLFEEDHWDTGEPFGTAKPLRLITMLPGDIATSIQGNTKLFTYLNELHLHHLPERLRLAAWLQIQADS